MVIESDFKPLGRAEAAKLGVVLTESQAVALAFVLAGSAAALEHVVRGFCADLPAPEYNLDFEHPVHTWGRWAAALDNDETPPCQRYPDYVADQLEREQGEQEFQDSLRSGEHEPGDAIPFTDEELADLDDDDDNMNPPNELAYEHLN